MVHPKVETNLKLQIGMFNVKSQFVAGKLDKKAVKNFVKHSDRTQNETNPANLNIIQIYSPTLDKFENEVTQLYRQIRVNGSGQEKLWAQN